MGNHEIALDLLATEQLTYLSHMGMVASTPTLHLGEGSTPVEMGETWGNVEMKIDDNVHYVNNYDYGHHVNDSDEPTTVYASEDNVNEDNDGDCNCGCENSPPELNGNTKTAVTEAGIAPAMNQEEQSMSFKCME